MFVPGRADDQCSGAANAPAAVASISAEPPPAPKVEAPKPKPVNAVCPVSDHDGDRA